MAYIKKVKPEKQLKEKKVKEQKQQLNQSIELGDEEEVLNDDDPEIEPYEKLTSIFTPIERKDPLVLIQEWWFKDLSSEILDAFKVSLELAYFEQKNKWESEERISKPRREYLQGLYDRLQDVKITIQQNNKKTIK